MRSYNGLSLAICLSAVASALLFSSAAAGGASSADNSPATEFDTGVSALPNLNVTTGTNGTAELRGGVSVYFPGVVRREDHDVWDLAITPLASVEAISGTATVVPFQRGVSGASYPWKLGGSLVFLHTPVLWSERRYADWGIKEGKGDAALRKAKIALGVQCIDGCGRDPSKMSQRDKDFCERWKGFAGQTPDASKKADLQNDFLKNSAPDDLCDGAQQPMRKLHTWEASNVPVFFISFGGSGGQQQFAYFVETSAANQSYDKASVVKVPWDAGVHMAWVQLGALGPSEELLILYSKSWTASTTDVQRSETEGYYKGDKNAPLNMTQKLPLNAPANAEKITARFYLGGVDLRKGLWRFAGGGGVEYDLVKSDKSPATPFVETPFTLKFAATDDNGYKGLVRAAPQLRWVPTQNRSHSMQFLFVVSLLGQRQMFAEDYDRY